MLGKLFNLGTAGASSASASSQTNSPKPPPPSLESVQEDIHTRNLLFPDAQALFQHRNDQVFPLPSATVLPSTATANPFDYDGDIDLDARDVRVMIMQDALSSVSSQLLFDSHAPPPLPPSAPDRPATGIGIVPDHRRTPTSPRKSSLNQTSRPLVIQPGSPQARQGAFDRRASIQGRAQTYAETEGQRARREYNEEISAFSGCIFGNSELMAYKGTSTKVHIVPAEQRPEYASSFFGDGRGSVGRSSLRSSRLAQSYSSGTVSPIHPAPSFMSSAPAPRHADRRKILITRLFPVILPTDDTDVHNDTPMSRFSDQSMGYPFPQPSPSDESGQKKKKPQPKQKRTPMYAVVLVIHVPAGPSQLVPPPSSRSNFRGPGSYTDQDSFPSSLNSARRSGWTMAGAGFHESLDSSYTTDVEDRIDDLTQHWDIIMRTLTSLQSVVASTLSTMLKQADIASPDPYPNVVSSFVARTPSASGRRGDEAHAIKPPKTNAKVIALPPHCLQQDGNIAVEASMARVRIVTGLCAERVITGQGRWGIWRDEARWMARKAGGKDQGFFFNLLTGFLATHTDWLQALSPAWYRKRHFQQQKLKGEEDTSIPARTVIVAQDKMAARRLIFLLAAFLPANQQLPAARTHRPSTSASFGFSQSPPAYVIPVLREESLRRKINRRTGPRRASHSRTVSQSNRAAGVPAQLAHLSIDAQHERRVSDATSVRSNLPIPGSDLGSRKSSAATTTTITPETTIPHFSTMHRFDTQRGTRPGSSGSVAADDLKRSLRRGDSMGHISITSSDSRSQSSRWGSVISGLWSAKRRDSTNATAQTHSTGSHGSNPTSPTKLTAPKPDKLSEMVREVSAAEESGQVNSGDRVYTPEFNDPTTPRGLPDEQSADENPERISFAERTPDPLGAFVSPVKTSINVDDGVIDVDIPFPDYITSFETAVSSPSSSGYLSTPGIGVGLDGFEQLSRIAIDGDLPLNVAGWLQRYHQDFVLQAIPPQEDLLEEVKASLKAEPSPAITLQDPTEQPADRWVDISSAIIADTTTHSIKRIRYRRLIRPKPTSERPIPLGSAGSSVYGTALLTPQVQPYETQLKEEFIVEDLETLDQALIDAVEKVIAQSSDVSKHSSSNSSRSNSKRRDRSNSEASQPDETHYQPPVLSQEVPRGECKTVVLSALNDIIREVIDKRDQDSHNGNGHGGDRGSALREAVRFWLESVESGE